MNYKDLQRLVKKANSRLLRIQRFSGKDVAWAGKQLQAKLDNEKLSAWSSASTIKISRDMSEMQLERIYKATENFLNSQTSTIRGIKGKIKSIKEGFKSNLGVTNEEAEAIYQAFEEDLIKWALRYIDASRLWALVEEAKEYNYSLKTFEDRFLELSQLQNDLDIKEKIKGIYERYV